ncbi:Retrovirus-related Pol polyprotein from transposon 412 [Araneus ventricosus]|uniref:Retrovirus-related Pol polyprotein from transposon 412 n=1 Tax=Araneus ventricosus TaxID=182803 RepID=A0A4Y2CLJ5_ARAVE|nr:Retrovirus-related Pol polyprotein from transposon 412 [Araneus ventricosus]
MALDILGPFPVTTKGNRYVLVLMDYFTKWPEAIPIPDQEASTVAEELVRSWISCYGVPMILHLDQGTNFNSAVFTEFCKLLGILKTRRTVLYPESDGMVERFNRTILNRLSLFVSRNQTDWDTHLPLFLLAYRNTEHEVTGLTPVEMLFGRMLRLPCDILFGRPSEMPSSPIEYMKNLEACLESVHAFARERIKLASERMKTRYDSRETDHHFKEGDLVWMYNPKQRRGLSPKLQQNWEGPYTNSLVSAGPFKCVQDSTLRKLRKQLSCLKALANVLKRSNFCICDFFEDSEDDIRQIWTRICGNALYCVADHFSFEMENELRSIAVLDSYMASIVSPRLVSDILDSSHFDPTSRISVLQFKSYFGTHDKAHSMILEFVADSLAAEDLKCKDVQKAFYAVSVLSKIVPSSYSLFYVGALLIDSNPDLKNVAVTYLKAVCTNDDLRLKVISSYLKMLQSGNVASRLISIKAIEMLQAKHCVDQIEYVAEKDSDSGVREAANCVLISIRESLGLEKT